MKKEQIHLEDWRRILIGDTPSEFLLEVFIRTALIYLVLVVTMRLLGKRMNGQLTIIELAVMLTMGAIISPAMQLPDRGLLPGVVAMCCTLVFLRGTNLWGIKSKKAERVIQGIETAIVKDGILQLDEMARNRLSHQQVFAALRGANIYNLSKVKRLYLEAYGMFSVYSEDQDRPGLSVLPTPDEEVHSIHKNTNHQTVACCNCGNTAPANPQPGACSICQKTEWVEAII